MKIKYYLNTNEEGCTTLSVTSRSEYWLNEVELNTSPSLGTEIFDLEKDINNDSISIGFDGVEANIFRYVIEHINIQRSIKILAIHNSDIEIDLTLSLNLDHLIIGLNNNINMSKWNINAREITFYSLKTFKGILPNSFSIVEKLTVWDDKNRINDLLKLFVLITELKITNSNIEELDLKSLKQLKMAHLAHLNKLVNIEIPSPNKLERIIVEKCKKYIPTDEIKNTINIVKF